ncbi:MAG TPA: hypothetical protein VF650_13315 [Allosphingosinicella sp.]|jgi:hypothetical protein
MQLVETIITEGSIELTYSDGLALEQAKSLIVIRMPVATDAERMLLTLRQEALRLAQAVLEKEIAATAHILDPAR